MKKLLIPLALCLVALSGLAATIVWYSDAPPATSISGSDLWAIERSGPQRYEYATMDQVSRYAATNGIWNQSGGLIFPVTMDSVSISYDISTNAGSTIQYSSALYNSTNAGIYARANLESAKTGGPVYTGVLGVSSGNTGGHSSSISIQAASTTSGSSLLLRGMTEGSAKYNLDENGLDTAGRVNSLSSSVTNGYYTWTNTWANAATGTVDMSITDQALKLTTDASITGIINKSNYVSETVVLTFTNSTAANHLITLAAGIVIPQRTNQVVSSNGTVCTLSLRWHPAIGTNGVWVQF